MRIAQKTASYGAMHLIVAFVVAYALTRDWRAALAIGLVEPFFQTFAFALHERVWARIQARRERAGTVGLPTGSTATA